METVQYVPLTNDPGPAWRWVDFRFDNRADANRFTLDLARLYACGLGQLRTWAGPTKRGSFARGDGYFSVRVMVGQ